MNYYEHHLGDYDGATAHLSWMEDCAYRRLICLYYRNESPIPSDIKQACRLVRAASKGERDAVQQVLSEFFRLENDGWHHKRCDEDLDRYHEKSRKARESVSKRWANRDAIVTEKTYEQDTNVSETYDERNTPRARPQTPDTRHQTPKEKKTTSSKKSTVSLDQLVADGLTPEVAQGWLDHRQSRKAPLTALAWSGFRAEAEKAGWQLEDAVRKAISRNWTSVEAEWLRNAGGSQSSPRLAQPESFRERDLRKASEDFDFLTGRLSSPAPWSAFDRPDDVIDMEAEHAPRRLG